MSHMNTRSSGDLKKKTMLTLVKKNFRNLSKFITNIGKIGLAFYVTLIYSAIIALKLLSTFDNKL